MVQSYDETIISIKTNRQKSIYKTTKGKFWCPRCDANLIGQIGKCSNCGYRDKNKKKEKLNGN